MADGQRNCNENIDTNHNMETYPILSNVGGSNKRRYQVLSTPLQHVVMPSSITHLVSWEGWHDQLWKESSQYQQHHQQHPTSIGYRSLLQEQQDDNGDNNTYSTTSSPLFIRLEDEDTIHRSLLLSSVPLQGKIYYPKPAKKTKKTARSHPTTAESVVIPLPDLMDPPPKWKLGPDVSTTEKDLPFGASLPKLHQGKEVNVRAKKSSPPRGSPYNKKDPFRNHLNWATTDNPDRVPLVHEPIDQGPCGSCWAYVTTGSLETSLARRVAQTVFWQQLNHTNTPTSTSPSNDTVLSNPATTTSTNSTTNSTTTTKRNNRRNKRTALTVAQWVESLVFNQTRLSIQELLDCDTQIDQGCIGGNPLLAFFYIHKYGLTSWDNYPYASIKMDTCARADKRDVSQYNFPTNNNKGQRGGKASSPPSSTSFFPLATVDSWGILPKNHEDMIQVALRYIGPVAVAINGGDDDFIRYSGGIFDKTSCSQEANHAVLIVGYGQEEIPHKDGTEIIRYWIARNSWGPLWGENGYIRIARGSGKKKVPGICGIARSPSVALGGRLLFSPFLSEDSEGGDGVSGRNNDGDDGAGWWLDFSGGSADGGSSAYDEDFYHDFVENEWPQFCNAITPLDTFWHVGCRRIIHVFDNHRAASLGVLSLLVLSLLAFLLTYPCRLRQERRKLLIRQRQRLQQQQQEQQEQLERGDNVDENEGDEVQDPSGHGSLSISSDEGSTAAGQFAILEDDLEEETHTTTTEKVPLLMKQRNGSRHPYGSVVADHNDNGCDSTSNTTGSNKEDTNKNKNKNQDGGPTQLQPPPKESSEIASSLFSTSSGRSWFFLQK